MHQFDSSPTHQLVRTLCEVSVPHEEFHEVARTHLANALSVTPGDFDAAVPANGIVEKASGFLRLINSGVNGFFNISQATQAVEWQMGNIINSDKLQKGVQYPYVAAYNSNPGIVIFIIGTIGPQNPCALGYYLITGTSVPPPTGPQSGDGTWNSN
ncbi:hypothetical protein FRC07_003385 [Ceratobasidium sp. 392]|nr:hypothetical protein FRC07_003385 [Ceratobasidium sp. 392]